MWVWLATASAQDSFPEADFSLSPRKDRDQDGIHNMDDSCPDYAETWNHVDDADGCPEVDPPAEDSPLGGIERVLDLVEPPPPAPAPAPAAPVPAPDAPVAPTNPRAGLPSVDGRLPTGVKSPKDAAVVVGLEDYAFVADVPHARRDADAFATFLTYTRGVPLDRIRTVSSGSVEVLRQALAEAGGRVGPGGTVWVYFAGHGAGSIATGERVLLGDDVRPDPIAFDARTLAVSEVERLASAGGGRAMLVLDTCYAGSGRDGKALLAGRRFAIPTYATVSPAGAAQWLAAAPNELSGPLEEVQHGAFTYVAVGALRGWADGELDGRPDGKVTAGEATAFVGRALRTLQVVDQHPAWVGGDPELVLSTGTEAAPETLR